MKVVAIQFFDTLRILLFTVLHLFGERLHWIRIEDIDPVSSDQQLPIQTNRQTSHCSIRRVADKIGPRLAVVVGNKDSCGGADKDIAIRANGY